jgi:hypothetical protein
VVAHEMEERLVAHEPASELEGMAVALGFGLRDEFEP